MSSAVPLGSKPKKYKNFKQFLTDKKYRYRQYILKFIQDYDIKVKLKIGVKYLLDVVLTGSVIWYSLHGTLDFVRYGLLSALFLYYLEKSTAIIGSNLFRKKDGK